MKHTLSLSAMLLMALLWSACGKTSSTASTETADSLASEAVEATTPEAAGQDPAMQAMLGSYVGPFAASKYHSGKDPSYTNRINITIDQLAGGKVEGHSVVAGNSRPFSGTYTAVGDKYEMQAKEPGDDKYDGSFSFTLDPTKRTLTGTWVANDGKIAVYERKYELEWKEFRYDPNLELPEDVQYEYLFSSMNEFEYEMGGERLSSDVLKFNPSKVKLKAEDIENMYKGDLEIMRNSIYARHGYSFKTRKMRYVFDSAVPWYIPRSLDVSKELTQLEQENIALLKRYEQHADSYYDSFGR